MINNTLLISIPIELLNKRKKKFSKPQTGFIDIGLLCKLSKAHKLVSRCYRQCKLK